VATCGRKLHEVYLKIALHVAHVEPEIVDQDFFKGLTLCQSEGTQLMLFSPPVVGLFKKDWKKKHGHPMTPLATQHCSNDYVRQVSIVD